MGMSLRDWDLFLHEVQRATPATRSSPKPNKPSRRPNRPRKPEEGSRSESGSPLMDTRFGDSFLKSERFQAVAPKGSRTWIHAYHYLSADA